MGINIEEIERTLIEHADFEEVASVSRAKTFITAAKRWIILQPQMATRDGNSMTLSVAQVNGLLARAHSYVNAKDDDSAGTSRVRFMSFRSDFR